MKKATAAFLVVLILIIAFSGCDSIRTSPVVGKIMPQKYVLGTWEGTKEFAIGDMKYTFTFNEDGTGIISTPGVDLGITMKYSIDGEELSITTEILGVAKTETYTMAFDDGKLLLTVDEDTITLTRQEKD